MSSLFDLARPVLFRLGPETAHSLSILALKSGVVPPCPVVADSRLVVSAAGLEFPNPVGLAAGYDKNAEVPDAILKLGFGSAEVGSVTPRPQTGNLPPRLYRLPQAQAVINRMGFNNEGHAAALKRLMARKKRVGIVGVNIGANKDSADLVADYELGIETFYPVADYFTANISSPNTPGLRDLQASDALAKLLARVIGRRDTLAKASGIARPVFLKIAPDLDNRQIGEIAAVVQGVSLDGLVISNTTTARQGVETLPYATETGGLSGRPLFERSTIVLARMRRLLGNKITIIGAGGIDDGATAIAKLEAGANLLQLYTGMIYRGPGLAAEINRAIVSEMNRRNLKDVAGFTGVKTSQWAERALPGE